MHIHVLCDDDDGAPPRKPDDRSMLTEQEEDETNCVLSSGQDTNQLTTTPAKCLKVRLRAAQQGRDKGQCDQIWQFFGLWATF